MSLVSRLLDCANEGQMAKVFRQWSPDRATAEIRELLAQAGWEDDYGEPDAVMSARDRRGLKQRAQVAYEERVIVEIEDEASALMSGIDRHLD
jgi:hypothetical protein